MLILPSARMCIKLSSTDCVIVAIILNYNKYCIIYSELLDWKMRFDESENLAVRMVRGITDKVSSLLGKSQLDCPMP